MRGKAILVVQSSRCLRITPAHAGKSSSGCDAAGAAWNHPRTCGEKALASGTATIWWGSPPHMRGKASRTQFNRDQIRITPAHAGKRGKFLHLEMVCKDHPRTCGEKFPISNQRGPWLGSPPHMRGKGVVSAQLRAILRITPAHAGKSVVVAVVPAIQRDHPRTCGEKTTTGAAPVGGFGSPPHMRGKVLLDPFQFKPNGITPACAGKSRCF